MRQRKPTILFCQSDTSEHGGSEILLGGEEISKRGGRTDLGPCCLFVFGNSPITSQISSEQIRVLKHKELLPAS